MGEKVSWFPLTKIVQVTQAPDISGEVAFDVEIDLYSDGKEDWVASGELNKWKFPVEAIGGQDLPGEKELGTTFFLNYGWKIRPYESTHVFNVNGNLYTDAGDSPFTPTVGTFNVMTIQQVSSLVDSTVTQLEQIEYASFNNGVTIDVINGVAGVGEPGSPVGNLQNPVNNVSDALLIADDKGFNKFFIHGDLTLGAGHDVVGFSFEGESPVKSTALIETAASTLGCEFKECTISGVLDGNTVLEHCEVNALEYVNGEIRNCRLGGPISLGGGVQSLFLNCGGVNPGLPPIIDMGGSGQDCILHDYSGGLKFQNMTSGENQIRVQLDGGKAVLMPTISSGKVTIVGIGLLIDSTGEPILSGTWNGGVTVLNALVNVDTVAGATWEQTQKLKYRIESLRNGHVAFGNTFYWNPGDGDDVNDGETYAAAVKTFARAHELVTSEHGDVITIVGGTDFIVDEHIIVTKNDVHVRGQGPGTQVQVASGIAINISGDHCSAEAIKLDGGDTGVIVTGDGFSGVDLTVVNVSGNGVEVTSVGSKLDSVYCSDCGGNNVELKNGTVGLRLENCGIRNGTNGININAGVIGTVLGQSSNVSSNSNYGVNINPGAIGTIIYSGAIIHSNTVGDINDNGIGTVIRSTDDSISEAVWADSDAVSLLADISKILGVTYIKEATVDDLSASTTKFVTTFTEAGTFWLRAALLFLDGDNAGSIRGIKTYNGVTKEVQLQTPLPYAPANGNKIVIIAARKFLTPDSIELAEAVWADSSGITLMGDVKKVLGLTQENYYLDETVYTTHNEIKLLTSGRIRLYSNAASVGTADDVIATYTITASWTNDELDDYKVVKI